SLLQLLNVFGGTLTHALGAFDLIREKLQETGRQDHDINLENGPPFARLDPAKLTAGTEKLRGTGFRIALDGVGDGDVPLTLVSNLQANMIKLDRTVVSGLPEDGGRMALVEAVQIGRAHV